MYELKPCPFCGGEAVVIEHPLEPQITTFGVECSWCGGKTEQNFVSKIGAIGAWNRRANDDNSLSER